MQWYRLLLVLVSIVLSLVTGRIGIIHLGNDWFRAIINLISTFLCLFLAWLMLVDPRGMWKEKP